MRYVPLLEQKMRNVVGFPERIGGRDMGLFRPTEITGGDVGGIFTQSRRGWKNANQQSGELRYLRNQLIFGLYFSKRTGKRYL
jgi:hypothetical protein